MENPVIFFITSLLFFLLHFPVIYWLYFRRRRQEADQRRRVMLALSYHWYRPADAPLIAWAVNQARQEGCGGAFHARLSELRQRDYFTLGELWQTLEQSRLDAGIKTDPAPFLYQAPPFTA
nr:hypothetical protein [uncultured Halomonas sp.]